jgi:molybdopterin molybdotransferase
MIPVSEAIARILEFGGNYPIETVSLAQATGRILREAVHADREYPAEDRSRMDGLALVAAVCERGQRTFPVLGMARAGEKRQSLGDAAGCLEIMTGASIPLGADTVVPYEEVTIEKGVATVALGAAVAVTPGRFIHTRGSDCRQGEVLVDAGERLTPVRIAAAASMGYSTLRVSRRPRISVLTTGDELVAVDVVPAAHQVRGSNGPALCAMMQAFGDVRLETVGDDRVELHDRLARLLESSDVILLTGGVSAGKFDEVPGVLNGLGVREVFHKVAQKPGKPLWFGAQARASTETAASGVLVFGLPGNPVSSLVCARRYVVPLLQAKSGWCARGQAMSAPKVRLEAASELGASRLTRFYPVRLTEPGSAALVQVNGSGDFTGLGRSDGFVEVPAMALEGNAFSPLPEGGLMSFFGWES